MKKLHINALIFISISLGLIFTAGYLFLFITNLREGSQYIPDGLSVPLSLVVLAELIPVFALLYISAAMILKKYFHRERSAGASQLLAIAMLADGFLWYFWTHGSVRSDIMRPLFIPAILIAAGLWIFTEIAPKTAPDQ